MDGDDGVLAIHLAGEHRPGFPGLHVTGKRVEAAIEIGADVFAAARPFEQHAEVVALAPQRFRQRAILFEAAAALQRLLRRALILPEFRQGDLLFEVAELARQARFVKAPSAGGSRVR
jgi:hypothetical protein